MPRYIRIFNNKQIQIAVRPASPRARLPNRVMRSGFTASTSLPTISSIFASSMGTVDMAVKRIIAGGMQDTRPVCDSPVKTYSMASV